MKLDRIGMARESGSGLDRLERDDTPRSPLFKCARDPSGHVDLGILITRQEWMFEQLSIGRSSGSLLYQTGSDQLALHLGACEEPVAYHLATKSWASALYPAGNVGGGPWTIAVN